MLTFVLRFIDFDNLQNFVNIRRGSPEDYEYRSNILYNAVILSRDNDDGIYYAFDCEEKIMKKFLTWGSVHENNKPQIGLSYGIAKPDMKLLELFEFYDSNKKDIKTTIENISNGKPLI